MKLIKTNKGKVLFNVYISVPDRKTCTKSGTLHVKMQTNFSTNIVIFPTSALALTRITSCKNIIGIVEHTAGAVFVVFWLVLPFRERRSFIQFSWKYNCIYKLSLENLSLRVILKIIFWNFANFSLDILIKYIAEEHGVITYFQNSVPIEHAGMQKMIVMENASDEKNMRHWRTGDESWCRHIH